MLNTDEGFPIAALSGILVFLLILLALSIIPYGRKKEKKTV